MHRRPLASTLLAVVLPLCLLGSAIAQPAAQAVGLYRVRVDVPPHLGRVPVTVYIERPEHTSQGLQQVPCERLRVRVRAGMPSMPAMQLAPVDLVASSPGRYQGAVDLSMPGAWLLDVSIAGPPGTGHLAVPLTVAEDESAAPPTASPSPTESPSGSPTESRTGSGRIPRIVVRAPSPPSVGAATFDVEVTPADEGLHVWGGLTMPGMTMYVAPREATRIGPGRYALDVPLTMAGLWRLTVDVDRGANRVARQSVDVTVAPAAGSRPRWPAIWTGLAAAALVYFGGAIALALARKQSTPLPTLLGCFFLLSAALAGGAFLRAHWPPDRSMGMTMDMAAPDMGMGDLHAPLPVVLEPPRREPVRATARVRAVVEALPGRDARKEVRLSGRIDADDAELLRAGTRVDLLEPMDARCRTRVERLSSIDPATQSVTFEARAPGAFLRVGQLVALDVEVDRRSDALTVPLSSVYEYYGHASVWVADDVAGQLVARRRTVQTGLRADPRVEILHGLTVADRVVAAGGDALREDTVVVAVREGGRPYRTTPFP
jgi:hypothetical protein